MMKRLSLLALAGSGTSAFMLASTGAAGTRADWRAPRCASMMADGAGAYGFNVRDLDTNDAVDLSKYEGSVSLIVNVASK